MNRQNQHLAKNITRIKDSFTRFPETLLASAAAGCLIILILNEIQAWNSTINGIGMGLILSIPLTFALTTWLESIGKQSSIFRIGVTLLAILTVTIHIFIARNFSLTRVMYVFIQHCLIAHLLVAFLPFFKESKQKFWIYNKELFLNFTGSIFFSSVLFFGLSVALLAIKFLFSIRLEEDAFSHLGIIILFVFNTWFFLSNAPQATGLDSEVHYPNKLKLLTQFFLVPLLYLYIGILYVYFVRIGWTGELPKGTIGYLVSGVSLLGIFTVLLMDPLNTLTTSSWIKVFLKIFYWALLPLVGLLLWGTKYRIQEYGVTENRYFLLICGLWVAVTAIYMIFSSKKDIRIIPISLSLATVIATWGPTSAYSVSYSSQFQRLKSFMVKFNINIDQNGKVKPTDSKIPVDAKRTASTIIRYFISMHQADGIKTWFNLKDSELNFLQASVSKDSSYVSNISVANTMTSQMGFPFQDYVGRNYSEFFNFYEKNSQTWVGAQSWNTKGYSKLYNIDLSPDSGKKNSDRNQIFVPNVGTYVFTVADSPPRLIWEINGKTNSISLDENLKILNSSKKNVFSETEMMITPIDSAIPFKIYMMNVSGKIEDEMLTLNSVKIAILVK